MRNILFVLFWGLIVRSPQAAESPAIAAAADLRFVLTEVAEQFTATTGKAVKLTFGSSGHFAHQIQHGGPFEVFLSADEDYVRALVREGLAQDEGVPYAVGRIVLAMPHGSPLATEDPFAALGTALQEGRLSRFAIATPEHAPYGKRAEEVLRHLGLWERPGSHLVLGENVAQAAQFAVSGAAAGGPNRVVHRPGARVCPAGHVCSGARGLACPVASTHGVVERGGHRCAGFLCFLANAPPARLFAPLWFRAAGLHGTLTRPHPLWAFPNTLFSLPP